MLRRRHIAQTTRRAVVSLLSACSARSVSGLASHGLTDDQRTFQESAAGFARVAVEPNAQLWDNEKKFPRETFQKAAELGFAGIYASSEYGMGLSRVDASVIFEQLAGACPAFTSFLTIHNMCAWMVDSFASDAVRAELMPSLTSMERVASYCLTEPTSGSDAASLRTTATADGDSFVLNGSKAFISGAGESDTYVVMVRTGEPGAKGISCLAIDKNTEGLSFGKNEKKLGWCCQPTRTVMFDNARVPKSRLLGKEGDGFKIAMKGLDGGRINIATCSLGSAQRCLDLASSYTKDRKQFGKPIAAFQNTQFRLAEMATKVHSSRLIIRSAAKAVDEKNPDATTMCAMAKLHATEECYSVVDQALQLHGGYGYLNDFPIERHMRDLRVHRILEGTNEVMRMIVSRAV